MAVPLVYGGISAEEIVILFAFDVVDEYPLKKKKNLIFNILTVYNYTFIILTVHNYFREKFNFQKIRKLFSNLLVSIGQTSKVTEIFNNLQIGIRQKR